MVLVLELFEAACNSRNNDCIKFIRELKIIALIAICPLASASFLATWCHGTVMTDVCHQDITSKPFHCMLLFVAVNMKECPFPSLADLS